MSRHVAATTPYAWPWHGRLDPAQTAVLVVAERSTTSLEPRAGQVVEAATVAGALVVHVSTGAPGDAAKALRLPGPPPHASVAAHGWDGFFGSGLDAVLRRHRVDCLLLVGTGLETGVHSTMRSANDRGYECLLVADACTAGDQALTGPALSMVEMSGGIFGAVGRSADVLQALTPTTP